MAPQCYHGIDIIATRCAACDQARIRELESQVKGADDANARLMERISELAANYEKLWEISERRGAEIVRLNDLRQKETGELEADNDRLREALGAADNEIEETQRELNKMKHDKNPYG